MTKTAKIIISASLVVISTVMTAVGIKTLNTKVNKYDCRQNRKTC